MTRNCFPSLEENKKDIPDSESQQKQQSPLNTSQLDDIDQNRPLCGDEKPFRVVLIDLKHAVDYKEIHCVEKPLSDMDDLKFVAISYRWGEVQETTVDTGVGYLATVSSFDMDDFLNLCWYITREDDLQSMEYVWVDAICVNQTNHEQRKATIYHMTDIYERANYILAVPDLHLRYLRESGKYLREIIVGSSDCNKYIYHLVHGNIQELLKYDQEWLNDCGVPKDNQRLRHLLTHYTEHFATALVTCGKMNKDFRSYKQKDALQHIFETTMTTTTTTTAATRTPPSLFSNDDGDCNNDEDKVGMDKSPVDESNNLDTSATINQLHTCNDDKLCPLNMLFNDYYYDDGNETYDQLWKLQIPERSHAIRQSVDYMKDLVMDWASRAWVVSEFHIARNKSNKMKYWFIQLVDDDSDFPRFFTFDFDDAFLSSTCGGGQAAVTDTTICHFTGGTYHTSKNVFHAFHSAMRQQLTQQTFLERMLKSKASRHEDRFHAILPSSDYKSILDIKDIDDHWHNNINTLVDVKLELYKWMTTKHKLELLFLAGNDNTIKRPVLPSFATTSIQWPDVALYPAITAMDDPDFPGNFDLGSLSTIQLIPHHQGKSSSSSYKLNIKPREYYQLVKKSHFDQTNRILSRLLALKLIGHDDDDDHDPDSYDVIIISNYRKQATKSKGHWARKYGDIVLAGYMTRNKWVLMGDSSTVDLSLLLCVPDARKQAKRQFCQCDENGPGFDIY